MKYLKTLLKDWDFDPSNGYWIADEIGGVYAYGDWLFISFDDMRYAVEHDVSAETYDEWQNYNSFALEFGQNTINLKSWCMGCPRLSQEQVDNLQKKKDELDALCAEYKIDILGYGK